MKLKTIHLVVGLATVGVFLYSGLYMRMGFPGLYQNVDAIRMLFRANHIYLLLCGLLNISLGIYGTSRIPAWRRKLQIYGSILMLIAPLFLTPAFFIEPATGSEIRPLTMIGIFLLFFGIICHLIGGFSKEV